MDKLELAQANCSLYRLQTISAYNDTSILALEAVQAKNRDDLVLFEALDKQFKFSKVQAEYMGRCWKNWSDAVKQFEKEKEK